jgi:ribonucleoside-diphosphate reductase alpha chain
MADAKFYESYARYNNDLNRYETWDEAVNRVMSMHRKKLASNMTSELSDMLDIVEKAYRDKKILGAQRALQFGGEQLLNKHAKMYNCTASYLDRTLFFGEAFYLMLCGCGVGFSVQKHHIAKLPAIAKRTKQAKTIVVEDSIEGWADAASALVRSFFVEPSEYQGRKLYFDLTKIRPKGAEISGGFKAPGPEPLRRALDKIEKLIKDLLDTGATRLKPITAYDIVMHLADAVISGGVRRAATICLFSHDDYDMITAKTGSWFVDNPQRGRSNNSAVLLRDSTQFEEFQSIMESVQHSGEPGFVWADDLEILFNPCVEVGMRGYTEDGRSGFQMCNLTEINGGMATSEEIFYEQCKAASILGTVQASYTDFNYVSEATKEIVDKEALIGVGITGWMNNPDILFNKEVMKKGAEIVKHWNKITANLIGINQAARTTVVKPSGNASVLLGCASGIHGEHAPRYIRHVQMNKETEVGQLFAKSNPSMVETSVWSDLDYVIAFPIEPKEGSIYKKDLLGVKQLEYVKLAQDYWIEYGTNHELCVAPYLKHNVSNTITVDDWDEVTRYIYDNRKSLCGISLLAAAGDRAYPQSPFTEVLTEQQILDLYGKVAMFASGLIEAGLTAFNNDLWTACNTALGFGEVLTDEHKDLLKRDFVRRFDKFSTNFKSKEECANCLKDVYNLHKWWKITSSAVPIDWASDLPKKGYTDVSTLGASGCAGSQCEIDF